jgi:hypothetical protein
MQNQFKVHPSIDGIVQLIAAIGYMLILVSWLVPLILQGPFVFYRPQFFRIAFYISFTLLFIIYLARLTIQTLKETVFLLTDTSLIKRSPVKQTTVLFAETESFRYIHVPFGFGIGFIRSHEKRIVFPFLIDNLPALVSGIHETLLRINKRSSFRAKEIDTFIHHARIAAFHQIHSITLLPAMLLFTVFSLLINTFTALFIWSIPLLFAFLWIMISMTIPGIGFLIGYAIITRNISRQLKITPENIPVYDASNVYLASSFGTVIFFLVIGILFKSNWTYLIN